jgi:hypothetical protein
MMISLSDAQLQTVMAAASGLPPEKRGTFLQRIAATLVRHHWFTDADVVDATRSALVGLVQGEVA